MRRPDTPSLLNDVSAGVAKWIRYQSRDEEGTQFATQTLDRGWGSRRDFAVLFAEAAGSLGVGARTVSGYLCNPDQQSVGSPGRHWPVGIALSAVFDHFQAQNGIVRGYFQDAVAAIVISCTILLLDHNRPNKDRLAICATVN